jgi:putative ABC transport system permease protein
MFWIERSFQHVRYGMRGLRREPVFAMTTLLTLALGTAATTTVFSVVDAELWRPLPYQRPHELLAAGSRAPDSQLTDGISLEEFQAWRQRVTAFSSLTPHAIGARRIAQLGYAESFLTNEVTGDYFTTLGLRPLAGRLFTRADGSDVAVLTQRGWRRVFNDDPAAVGRSFQLDDRAVTIIGVVANDDAMGPDRELYVPIDERSPQRGPQFYSVIGRLRPGASAVEAIQQLQAAIDEHATIDAARRGHRAFAEDLSAYYRRTNAQPLYFFLGASLLVLLLTIANVAGLMVSRAIRRTPEFAVRSAIGGGSRTLTAQLVVEGALIAVPGCAIGLALTYAATRLLGQFVPDEFLYRGTQIAIDVRVVLATTIVALITTAGLAIVPLGIIRRAGERAVLGAGHRTGEAPSAARSRRFLLIGQLAMTVTLLAGAGVFVKSYLALMQVPLGFDPANAWSVRIAMSGGRFDSAEAVRAYADDVEARLRRVPGIEHVAAASTSPLRSGWLAMVKPSAAAPETPEARAILRVVGADYFRATGTAIIRGRGISSDDRPGSPAVAVVNEELVRRAFGTADPLGRTIDVNTMRAPVSGQRGVTIVGVAASVKETGLNEVSFADVYLPFAQHPQSNIEFIVRGRGTNAVMNGALRAAATDPLVPVTGVTSMQDRVDQALQDERFNLLVVGAFAVLALLTAAIGVYGAMAYAVSARWRELGVRMALGASPRALLRGALWQSARLALIAGAMGLTGAFLFARWVGDGLYLVPGKHNGMLYNTRVDDPAALTSALLVIVTLALVAGAVPARRASRIDPVQALRAD